MPSKFKIPSFYQTQGEGVNAQLKQLTFYGPLCKMWGNGRVRQNGIQSV